MTDQPLISIIMAVYNARHFLDEAVESIRGQTLADWELILIDDGSTDGTLERIRTWDQQDARIRVFQTLENSGPGAARDFGIQKACGSYIAILDSDDVAAPDRLEKQRSFLQAHPDVVIVGTQADFVDEKGTVTGCMNFPTSSEKLYRFMYRFVPLLLPTVMINRSLLPDDFDWFEGWPFSEDTLLFFKLVQYGKLANLPDILLKYRQHASSVSARVPRETFLKTREARRRAVREMNYHPQRMDRVVEGLQSVAVRVLPEGLLWKVYRLVRKWMVKNA